MDPFCIGVVIEVPSRTDVSELPTEYIVSETNASLIRRI